MTQQWAILQHEAKINTFIKWELLEPGESNFVKQSIIIILQGYRERHGDIKDLDGG